MLQVNKRIKEVVDMDIAILQSLVTTLGFPIVLVGALLWFGYKAWGKMVEQNEKREDRLYNELGKAITANEKFAEIISTYTVKLDNIQSDVEYIKEKVGK